MWYIFYLSKFVVGQVQKSEMVFMSGSMWYLNVMNMVMSKIKHRHISKDGKIKERSGIFNLAGSHEAIVKKCGHMESRSKKINSPYCDSNQVLSPKIWAGIQV